jgi:DNA-binding CsgD family transcriptional regulator
MNRAGSVLCPILVGRDDLLELADRRIDEAAAGRGGLLLLAGQAGIGKSRLLSSIRRKARAAGFAVANGSVAPQDQVMPAALVLELARTLEKSPGMETLGRDLLAMRQDGDGDSLMRRRRYVVDVVARIVEATDRPTMLDFEDLQWADEISVEIVGELARRAGELPLLLVGAYRLDELKPGSFFREWRARLISQRMAEEARLAPLNHADTAVMTTLILNTGLPAPREVVAAVYDRTDGIPLHVEELLGALPPEAKTDGRAIRQARVPDTIEDAVLARIAQLSPDAQDVARAGAVIGRCFLPSVLAGIMDRPLHELDEPLRELQDHDFLYTADPGYFDYRHQLLRDTLYRSVPATELRRLHARAAEFGTALSGQSEIHASAHYELAGLRTPAFRAALAGAAEARRIGARSEAFELYRRALDNMPPDLSELEKADLYATYSDAAGDLERLDEMVRAAYIARDAYLAAGRPDKAAQLRINIWSAKGKAVAPFSEQLDELTALLGDLDALPQTDDLASVRCATLILRAATLADASRPDEALADIARARALAVRTGDRENVLDADLMAERVKVITGASPTTMEVGFDAARAARDAGYESVGVTGFRNLAIIATRALDYGTARRALAEGMRFADAIEASHCRQQMAVTTAFLDWADGHWHEATEAARQELVERGCRIGALGAMEVVGLVAATRGEVDAGRRWLVEALDGGKITGHIHRILPAMWALAELELFAGDPTASLARCEEALALAEASHEAALFVPFVVTGTRAALAARRPELAERWLMRAAAQVARLDRVARPAIAHATGLVQLSAGSAGVARDSLEEAVAGWTELGRSWEAAWARLDLATAYLRANRFGEATSLIAEVRGWAAALGSEPLVARADELTRLARGRTSPDEPWRPLTAREFEVARLIADGLTNPEIADQLSISPKTASAHVEHILAKLGVTRRAEIAAWTAAISRSEDRPARSGGVAVGARN